MYNDAVIALAKLNVNYVRFKISLKNLKFTISRIRFDKHRTMKLSILMSIRNLIHLTAILGLGLVMRTMCGNIKERIWIALRCKEYELLFAVIL